MGVSMDVIDALRAALKIKSTELTRLQLRIAFVEDERSQILDTLRKANDTTDKLLETRTRLEAELGLANKQIVETGRAWAADRERLEAQLQALREAAKLVWVQSTKPTDDGARLVGTQAWDALMSALQMEKKDGT